MQKHHNVFSKNDHGVRVFEICSFQEDEKACFVCQQVLEDMHFDKCFDNDSCDYMYYQRFTYDIKSLGNADILQCINHTLSEAYLKSSEASKKFYLLNRFGIYAFFHTHPYDFLSSCISFEIYSQVPFPENNIREISSRIRDYFYLSECEFNYGTFSIKNEKMLRDRQKLISRRSLLLLKSEMYSTELMERLYCFIIPGLTPLEFGNNNADNVILNNRIKVKD